MFKIGVLAHERVCTARPTAALKNHDVTKESIMTKEEVLHALVAYVLLPALVALATALTALAAKGAQYVHEKAKDSKLWGALDLVTATASTTVSELDASIKLKLPGYLEDGVLSDSEKADLKATALSVLKSKLPSSVLGILQLGLGNALDTVLGGKIEQAVLAQKTKVLAMDQAKAALTATPAPVPQSP